MYVFSPEAMHILTPLTPVITALLTPIYVAYVRKTPGGLILEDLKRPVSNTLSTT